MMTEHVLAFDVGGTKTAWALVDDQGAIIEDGRFPTPTEPEMFISTLSKLIAEHPCKSIGIGVAGIVKNSQELGILTNLPKLSGLKLGALLRESGSPLVVVENDARCALIGEVWKGSLHDAENALFLTIGTGIGGAVLRRGVVLPYPQDITKEISRTTVDPDDHFPSPTGPGTVEALLGGRSLEQRFGIPMDELAAEGKAGGEEALEVWAMISQYFYNSLGVLQSIWNTKQVIIGGKGAADLTLYIGNFTPPCPVLAAQLGEQAGLVGAARLALDLFEDAQKAWDE